MKNDIDILKKKLIYRSQYRGTKEMDKLIGNFVQTEIKNLNIDQLYKLEKFLEIDDDTLYKLYNNQIVEIDLLNNEIIEIFKKFDYK